MSQNLAGTFLRLKPDASIEQLPVDASFWQRLSTGELGDFHNEYLVTVSTSEADWPFFERHPNGDEIVCLLAGEITLVLEGIGECSLTKSGDFAFVPKGVWHTARVSESATMLFITAGEGTEHKSI